MFKGFFHREFSDGELALRARMREEERDPAFRRFHAEWIERRDVYLSKWGIVIGLVLNVVVLASLFLYDAANPWLIGVGHGLVTALILLWFVSLGDLSMVSV